jgi:hypothetical protein
MANMIFLLAFIENKVWTKFINRVVRKMHSHIFLILAGRSLIGTSCQPT